MPEQIGEVSWCIVLPHCDPGAWQGWFPRRGAGRRTRGNGEKSGWPAPGAFPCCTGQRPAGPPYEPGGLGVELGLVIAVALGQGLGVILQHFGQGFQQLVPRVKGREGFWVDPVQPEGARGPSQGLDQGGGGPIRAAEGPGPPPGPKQLQD